MNIREQFNFQDRIGRVHYLVFSLISIVIGACPILLRKIELVGSPYVVLILLIALTALVISWWLSFSITAKRLHDLGKSGWFSLLLFIPFVNIVFILILLLKSGDDNTNAFGSPPWGLLG